MAKVSGYQAAVDAAAAALKSEIAWLTSETNRLHGLLAGLISDGNGAAVKATKPAPTAKSATSAAAAKPKKGKRTRRSSEAVKAQAMEMVNFIKSKGKEGATGKEITAKFGPVLPSIKAFVNGRVDATSKIKSKGAASKTVYVA